MAETISLSVSGKVPKRFLGQIYADINPEYVRYLLKRYRMPTDRDTIKNVATSYRTFPTEDLALKAFETEDGVYFCGIASGSESRPERIAVKYLILEHVQERLSTARIVSDLNIAGLNPESIRYMKSRDMFKGKLTELRKIAERQGNLVDTTIGAYGALNA